MKCFNHEDREAVASCQKCGKGLCKECASKYTPCLCDECFARIQQQSAQQAQAAEENRKRKYIASLTYTRGEFFKTCLYGVLLAGGLLAFTAMGETPFEQIWKDFKITWPYLFCIPFGWRVTGAFKQNAPLALLNNTWAMLAFYGVQIAIAFTLGIPCFIYMFVKMLLAQRKLSKTKNNQ